MNYYEHHLGDYMRDAAHLSMIEEGAYRRLLDAYYIRGGPLPVDVDECCKLARATNAAERKAVVYVLGKFFLACEGGLRQGRADREIERFKGKQDKARASANARWGHSDRNADASANAMRTHSEGNAPRARPHSPDTSKPKEDKPPLVGGAGSRLDPAWKPGDSGIAYASKVGLTPQRMVAELEKFHDHWKAKAGKDGRKADWMAAWRTWCRNAVEMAAARGQPAAPDRYAGSTI